MWLLQPSLLRNDRSSLRISVDPSWDGNADGWLLHCQSRFDSNGSDGFLLPVDVGDDPGHGVDSLAGIEL